MTQLKLPPKKQPKPPPAAAGEPLKQMQKAAKGAARG